MEKKIDKCADKGTPDIKMIFNCHSAGWCNFVCLRLDNKKT